MTLNNVGEFLQTTSIWEICSTPNYYESSVSWMEKTKDISNFANGLLRTIDGQSMFFWWSTLKPTLTFCKMVFSINLNMPKIANKTVDVVSAVSHFYPAIQRWTYFMTENIFSSNYYWLLFVELKLHVKTYFNLSVKNIP